MRIVTRRRGTYDEKLHERLAECLDNVVDFQVQLVGSEQRPPTREDGVCNLEHANIDLGISV